LPNVENHVKFCVKVFGEANRELCYIVNSWMDAPSRKSGKAHRAFRHNTNFAIVDACRLFGDCIEKRRKVRVDYLSEFPIKVYEIPETEKNKMIASMILQHLKLDGLITPDEEKKWTWNQLWEDIEEEIWRGNYFFYPEIGLEKRMVNIFRKIEEEQKERERYAQLFQEIERERRETYAQLRREMVQKIAEISIKFNSISCAVLIAAIVGGFIMWFLTAFALGFPERFEAIFAGTFVSVLILSAGIFLERHLERWKMDQIRRVEEEYKKKLMSL